MMKLVNEFLGTTLLLWAVKKYGTPLAVGLGVALALYLSGGHLNPAVTAMKFFSGRMSQTAMLQMVGVQLLAAYVMVKFL